jgi:succinyl-CoA synthetase beta subunit
MFSVLSKRIAR